MTRVVLSSKNYATLVAFIWLIIGTVLEYMLGTLIAASWNMFDWDVWLRILAAVFWLTLAPSTTFCVWIIALKEDFYG